MELHPAPTQPNPEHSTAEFLQESAKPTIAAAQQLPPPPQPQGNAPAQPAAASTEPVSNYKAPDNAAPIFDNDDEEQQEGEQPASQQAGTQPTKAVQDFQDKSLHALLDFESFVKSMALSAWAGNTDMEAYKRDEEVTANLVQLFPAKYKAWIHAHFPEITGFLVVYGTDTTILWNKARKDRKVLKANKEAAADTETVRRVRNAVSSGGERNNWVLYRDGFYAKDAKGQYIKRTEENKHLLERPQIKDLDKILSVKANLHRDLLGPAFGWGNAEFEQHNIPE